MTTATPPGLAVEQGVERLLVRLPCGVAGPSALPAVDPVDLVSVSLTDPAGARRAADTLTARGYLLVGSVSARERGCWIDVVIPRVVLAGHEGWRALLEHGSARVLHPTFGPVAAVFGAVLDAHEHARGSQRRR